MNRSTFYEIKYMNRLGVFSKAGYMIGAGFRILTRTPILKLPLVPPSQFKTFLLSVYVSCVQLSCPNYAQWMMRYHLELLYSNQVHPTACAMLETGAMFIRSKKKKHFLGRLWI